jgi:hypothetical protein
MALVVAGAVEGALAKLAMVCATAPPQQAVALVQGCVISKLDYTCRTVHAAVGDAQYIRFDDMVVQWLERAMGARGWVNVVKVKQQLFLPASFGGLSFRAMEGAAEAAVLASHAAAYKFWGSSMPVPAAFDLQVQRFNLERVNVADRVPVNFITLMEQLCVLPKPQKHLAGLVRKRKEEQFLSRLSPEQLEQVAAMKDPGSALYLLSTDYGSVLPVHPHLEPFLEPEEYQYLFRRVLVGLSNPHNLDAAGPGLTCGRYFVSSGAVCGELVNLRLSHVESKCVGIRGHRKHSAVQNSLVIVARAVGLSATASGYILGSTNHGDITLSGFQPLSMVVDVKNINIKGVNVVARKAAKEKENEALYKVPCAQAGLDFKSFVTTVWGGFGVSATELIKVMAQRLVERENVSNSWAMTSIRRRIQSGFMKQIAINGLTYVRKIRAQSIAGPL